MAKERPKSPRARLFIALDLPEAVRSGIEAWGGKELRDPALRPVPRESLHITLAFLGYRAEKEIEPLGEVVAGLETPAPTVSLGEPVARPSGKRPRLLALPADSPGAVALQAELEERLVAMRRYQPEKRPFWPHVTVARVKPESRGSRRPMRISRLPGGLPQRLSQPFGAIRAALYLSELNPQGARYVPLAQVELSQNRRGGRDGR